MALVVVLAGGGTGGHIFPALALADTIRKREPETQICFIGTARGLETRYVPAAGYLLETVPSRPVLGHGFRSGLISGFVLLRGVVQAFRLLRTYRASVVIGVGGYASVPTVLAATISRIPTGLLEPNARPGRANRLLARFARAIFVQFDAAIPYFPRGRTEPFGFPVRTIPAPANCGDDTIRLLILGGSQGAHSINQAIVASLENFRNRPQVRITHQTGKADLEFVRQAYRQADIPAEVAPFFDDVPQRLASADLVIARAGASTIAELEVAGIASVLVPYPFAADDHQMANAREMEQIGASRVIPDAEVERRLAGEMDSLLRNAETRRTMARAARKHARPDAADRIWNLCRSWK